MRKFTSLFVFILLIAILAKGQPLNDNCANATSLCANSLSAATTINATTIGADPNLGCGPAAPQSTVWFTVTAISNGTATVTITGIDSTTGMTVEAFTGTCGSFTTTGQCATANGPAGSMNITFATLKDTVYYIMVSGRGSAQEAFNILATSGTNSIVAKPSPDFIANPSNGCIPLSVLLQNTSTTNGGTNITYQWKFDAGSFINASGNDTTVVYPARGTHTVSLKVSNNECGQKTVSQDIVAQDLISSIGYLPVTSCIGTPISFTGSAIILPDTPHVDPNIISWSWDFGDPNSGVNNTSSAQNPTHTFVGPGNSFSVQLIVQGTCGPDTASTIVNLLVKPTLHPSADQTICQGDAANLNVTVDNGAPTIIYNWSGPPTITCSACASTTVTGLAPGGPYTFLINIMDGNGCVADSLTHVTVNPKPVVNAGNDTTVCKNTFLTLSPSVTVGTGPFTYSWSPATGLSDPTAQNPIATITGTITYCVTVHDPAGCRSDSDCITISVFPPPTVSANPTFYCSSDPGPYNPVITVSGAGAGSTYQWMLSVDYITITGSNVDSSVVTLTLPTGVPNNYDYKVIVTDGVRGCVDTVPLIFPVIQGVPLSVNGPFTICQGGSANLVASGADTYLWTASPAYVFVDPTQDTQNVTPAATTIFIVTGTQGFCVKTDSIFVTVNPKPVVNAGNDTTVCRYTLLTLSPNVTASTGSLTYSWSPATGLDDATLKNPTATITGSVQYCITVTDSVGCSSDPDCIDIDIYPAPTISSSVPTYCSSDPGPDTTTFTVNGAHALSTYSWKLSPDYGLITGSNADSSAVNVTFPTGVPLTYNFTVIVNDPFTGCADTVFTSFTVTNGINMTVNGPFTICTGQSAMLTASNATTYAWTAVPAYAFGDPTLPNQNVSPAVTTNFIVTGTSGTCTKVDSILVTVNPLPVAQADSITPFCGCTTVALNGTGSSAGMSYLWTSTGGSIIADPASQFTTATTCAADVFTLTVTDTATGCFQSVIIPANNFPNPDAAADVTPSLICNGISTIVTLDGTGSDATAGTTYLWTSAPVVSITNDTALVATATVTGNTVFTLTVTTASGCDSVATAIVNIYPPPTISVSPGSLCTSSPSLVDTISISGASPGSTYNWTVIPACVSPASTSAQTQEFDFSTCGVGTYAFTIIVTDAVSSCVTTLNTSVDIVSGVTLVVSPDQVICEGDSVILTVSGADTYLWNTGATTDTIVVKGLTASLSPDTFIVTGSMGGCIAVDTIIVTINPTPVTSAINGPITVCEKDTTVIFSVADHPGNTYTWSVGGGSVLSGQGTDSITASWSGPGPATVTVHESNPSGCVSADQALNVTVNPTPAPPSIFGNTNVCANTSQLYSIAGDPGSTYQWTVSGGVFVLDSTGTFVVIDWGAGPTGTISAVETTGEGCSSDTASLSVIILPAPAAPVLVGPDTVCENAAGVIYNVTNTMGSFWTWDVSGGTFPSFSDSSQIAVDWGAAGTGMVLVQEIDSLGCLSSQDTLIVVIDSLPITSLITGNNSVCENDKSVIYTVDSIPGNTYAWTVSSGGVIISGQGTNSIAIDWSVPGTDTISVTETNQHGCIGVPETLAVTINPKPVTSPISGATTACENSTQQYSIVVDSGATYQWTATGGVISGSSTDTVVLVTWGPGPTGVVNVVETSAAGCFGDTVTLDITILTAPVLPVITGADTLCADSLGAIYSVTNNAGSYYLWTVTGGTIVSANDSTSQITVNWGNAGTDTVSVVEVNANTCPSLPAIFIVTLDSVPVTSPIAGDTSVCANDSAAIYSVTNTPGNIYNWSVTGGSISSGQGTDSILVNWAGAGAGTITVVETAPGGCSGLQQLLLVDIHAIPDSTVITGPDSVCEGSTTMYVVTGDSASTFLWAATNGTIVGSNTADTISVAWGTAGPGILQVAETSLYGCSAAPVILNITVNPVPNTSLITGNDTICISDTANIYFVTPTAGSTYTWSLAGGTITSGQGTDSITVNWDTAGADTVTVTETNSFGCTGTPVTKIVVVNATPVASASAAVLILCQLDSVQLTGLDSNAVSVNWHTSGSGTFSSDTILSPVYTAGATDSGTVILTLVVHNPPCADDSAIITLTVNPIPHVTITPPAPTICFGETDTLTVSGIGSYLWTPGNDTTASIIVSPDTTTTYTVVVTNSYSCAAIDSVVVIVIPPGIATAGPDQNVCLNDTIYLDGSVANAGGGVWTSNGNGTFIPDQFTLNAVYAPGTNDTTAVQFVLTTTGACLNGSDTMNVNVGATPSIDAGPDQTITYRDSAHLSGVAVNAGGLWITSGTGVFVPSDTSLNTTYSPSFYDLQQDSIILTLLSTNACRTISDFMVIHFSDFQIPNVFTPYPNSPGQNDFFEIKGLPPGSKLKIWNRWGLLVYESENYRNDWDAANVISDVYYYVVVTSKNEYHGWVKVIKE